MRPRCHQKHRDSRLVVRYRGRDSRLQNSGILPNVFLKNVIITSDLKFFQISGIFPSCFGCFLPANTTNKKSLNYRNFNQPCRWIVFAILEVSRPQLFETETRPETFETKTRKNVSRDESRDRDQVSRQVLFKRFCYGAPLKMFWLTHAPSLHSCIPFTDTSPVSPT